MPEKRNLIPAVSYLRMSSDKQTESIPEQRKAIIRYAAETGYRIIGEYVDSGISGDATEKRLEFQRMIADAASGEFKAILVWNSDRFGRFDSVEAGHWIYPLRKAGVRLVTLDSGPIDWDDFAGRLLWTVDTEAKHKFLRDLSRNAMRGRQATAESGAWVSKPPFGYRTEGEKRQRRLVLGPKSEVETVQRIFAEFLNGMSTRGVATLLNAEGIENANGKKWSAFSIRYKLKNRMYVGDTIWNRRSSGRYTRIVDGQPTPQKNDSRTNPESDWIVHEDTHPAIISRDDFEAAQIRLKERQKKTTPQRNGGAFVFTGLLRCSHCGNRMVGTRNRYICTGYHLHGKSVCRRYSVSHGQLADVVVKAIEGQFCNDSAVEKLRAEVHRQVKAGIGRDKARNLESRLTSIRRRLEKARERLTSCPDDLFDDVAAQVRKLKADEAETEAAFKAASTPANRAYADADAKVAAAVSGVYRLREAFQRADTTFAREFLQRLVESIELRFEIIPGRKRDSYKLVSGTINLTGREPTYLRSIVCS